MRIEGLTQAPFNTTFMGAMRGVAAHFGAGISDAFLYGASGHAFVMNIHRQLCPSGPYCFDRAGVERLLLNLGIAVEALGFFHVGSTAQERAAVETELCRALDAGLPCWLVNMEFQLITGYDETGLLTAQPWPREDFPPAHLTFGSWAEMGQEYHVDFSVGSRRTLAGRETAVRQALEYAVALWRDPAGGVRDDYALGPGAFQYWAQAVKDGHGGSHGNWWNGTVWAECRKMAGEFMHEVADLLPETAAARAVGDEYAAIGGLLAECSSKELADQDKLARLADARDREARCVDRLEAALARWE